jgi:hypothetical protein
MFLNCEEFQQRKRTIEKRIIVLLRSSMNWAIRCRWEERSGIRTKRVSRENSFCWEKTVYLWMINILISDDGLWFSLFALTFSSFSSWIYGHIVANVTQSMLKKIHNWRALKNEDENLFRHIAQTQKSRMWKYYHIIGNLNNSWLTAEDQMLNRIIIYLCFVDPGYLMFSMWVQNTEIKWVMLLFLLAIDAKFHHFVENQGCIWIAITINNYMNREWNVIWEVLKRYSREGMRENAKIFAHFTIYLILFIKRKVYEIWETKTKLSICWEGVK